MSEPKKQKSQWGLRRWGMIAGAILLVLLVALALRPRPIPVDVATVERGALEVTLDEEGETRVRERFVVSAPLAGRVLRIDYDPGDRVIAGETVLARFLPSEPVLLDSRSRAEASAAGRAAEAVYGRAKALALQAGAELEFAVSEQARYRRLVDSGIVPRERLDQADLAVDTRREAKQAADFAVASAYGDLEVARARLVQVQGGGAGRAIDLRSPVDGVVLRVLRESESVVLGGEPLLEVGDPADLEIVADFLSSDAVRMRSGNAVLIDRWGGVAALAGKVRRIEPSGFTKISALGVEEQRVNVIIDFAEPPERLAVLGDGFRVEVRVVVWQSDDLLRLPTGALFRSGSEWAVYCVEGGIARRRRVEVGAMSPQAAEVKSGLSEGDRVVLHPSDSVEDGGRVTAREG